MPRKKDNRKFHAANHRKKTSTRIDAEAARELLAQNNSEWPIERNDDADADLYWRIQSKLMKGQHHDPAEEERRSNRAQRLAQLHEALIQFPESTEATKEREKLFQEICDEAIAEQKEDGLTFRQTKGDRTAARGTNEERRQAIRDES
jgi:hypothetical protein